MNENQPSILKSGEGISAGSREAGSPIRIVVAEPDPEIRQQIARLFPAWHMEEVDNGRVALESIQRQLPALLLTETDLPDMDGFTLVQQIRSNLATRALPVIIMSARLDEESRVRGFDAGADEYLVKPAGDRELIARVRNLLELARLRRGDDEKALQVLQSIADGFYTVDADWRVTCVNAAAAENFRSQGVRPGTILGNNLWEVFPGARETRLYPEYTRVMEERVTTRFDLFYAPWQRWYQVRACPTDEGGFSAYFTDVTEAHLANEALQESERRFRALADAAPVMIWVSGPDKGCTWFNRSWLEFVGRSMEQVLGLGWLENVHPADRDRCAHAFESAFDARRRLEMEYRLRHHSGEYRWILDRAVPRFTPEGLFEGYISACSDIQDQRLAEEKLEGIVAERTVALRDTIAQLETFSYSITHDMRGPLRAMNSFSQLLKAEIDPLLSEDAREYLQRIMDSAQRMDRLIQDVLQYSRVSREQLPVEVVDLRKLIREVIRDYPDIAQRSANIRLDDSCGPLHVRGNTAALTQVLSNLLTNALKFMPPGRDPDVQIKCELRDGWVRVIVEDNGIGIPREYRDKIYGVFQRLHHREYPGTGIGLAIVKKAVERMGGSTGFDSQPGEGTSFWVELPSVKPKPN